MEEVWKDINLGTLNDQTPRSTPNLEGVILQDFLARPLHPSDTSILSSSQTASPLLTALSLSSHTNLHFHKPSSFSSLLGHRRHNRMIKNRESAARSRARKQAYTNELELEVQHLKEENARLKRQQRQVCEAAATEQKKKVTLYRASTAPF